jgi:hypothetical protein
MRKLPNFLFVVLLPATLAAQTLSFDNVVDRAIAGENALVSVLKGMHPIAETYIQDLENDTDFGVVPKTDHYFLGRVDLATTGTQKGLTEKSFLPKQGGSPRFLQAFTQFFSVKYLPQGFAQMIYVDGGAFDRDHYDFEFVRREFLGEVRTWVISVRPKKSAGRGRFIGSIWVEDRGFSIVRFNGTYSGSSGGRMFLHFDSWRVNAGPALWLPSQVYSEESELTDALKIHKLHFKALTRLWGYSTAAERKRDEFTNMTFEAAQVDDNSDVAADNSPVESRRAWERQAEDNILDRLEKSGMLARRGGVDKVLDTVVNNLIVTNNLNIEPAVRTRALLSTPLESFTVGHTIVISRGLLDTLPDEASLAAILAHELAHIALGHGSGTGFAFSDRIQFSDDQLLNKFRLARTQAEEDRANDEGVRLLETSPYKGQLGKAGLFLKALSHESDRLPSLIKPLFGSKIAATGRNEEGTANILRMSALMERSPALQTTRTDQIAALPLGSRTKVDPWTDELDMAKTRAVPLLSPREKMPFELAPVYLHLSYQSAEAARGKAALQSKSSR